MLGALSESIAIINSHRPQEMSKISQCFLEWGGKAESRTSSRNPKLPIPGVMLGADCCHAVGTVDGSCSGVRRAEPEHGSPGCVGLGRAVPVCTEGEASIKQFCFALPLLPHCLR